MDSKVSELIEQVNKGRNAMITLIKNYPGKVHYDSPKFREGKDHLCEKGSRLMEFALVTKKVKTFIPFNVGVGTVHVENDRLYINTDEYDLEDAKEALEGLLGNTETSIHHMVASRSGIAMADGNITWAEAERIYNAIVNL